MIANDESNHNRFALPNRTHYVDVLSLRHSIIHSIVSFIKPSSSASFLFHDLGKLHIYLASLMQAVLVHQLSKRSTQNPFKKNRGRVQRVAFHPTKPFFFVATHNHVRIYNLAKQALSKKLLGGSGTITCMAVHPSGDHVIIGSEDKRLAWFDLDLSDKPYKALRYHSYALRGVAFHRTYPLFASSSDDATVHVFHGTVYADLLSNPLIVPVKVPPFLIQAFMHTTASYLKKKLYFQMTPPLVCRCSAVMTCPTSAVCWTLHFTPHNHGCFLPAQTQISVCSAINYLRTEFSVTF